MTIPGKQDILTFNMCIGLLLVYCWTSVVDDAPTLNMLKRHWIDTSCCFGINNQKCNIRTLIFRYCGIIIRMYNTGATGQEKAREI